MISVTARPLEMMGRLSEFALFLRRGNMGTEAVPNETKDVLRTYHIVYQMAS
jgi:hypothetical protein